MKKIALLLVLLAGFNFTIAHAEAIVGEEGAKKSSDGKTVFPKEIENCEPCKKLWLANNEKKKKATDTAVKKSDDSKKAQTMDVKK